MTKAAPSVHLLRDPGHFLSLGFGSGLAPRAPGTCGTLAAVPLVIAFSYSSLSFYLITVISLFFLGIYLCERTASRLGVHDHPAIVFDEIVGFLVTMTFVTCTPINLLLGFALFRGFDILKPWPISWVDRRVQGGWGIMLDDLLAGIFAAMCLEFIEYISYS